jgi:hypothetical protein
MSVQSGKALRKSRLFHYELPTSRPEKEPFWPMSVDKEADSTAASSGALAAIT